MEFWNKDRFITDGRSSFHIYSDKHARIQFIQIPFRKNEDFFKITHGEVIVTVIIGNGLLKIKGKEIERNL